jgi:hypothetical protein
MKNFGKWLAIFGLPLVALMLFGVTVDTRAFASDRLADDLVYPLVMGVTIGSNVVTLADHAKRTDPSGRIARIAELLNVTNPILDDMHWEEGNLPTGHQHTVRTGLPTVAWRLINQGVQPSKSTTAQATETIGLLEAWSEVDVDLAKLAGDLNAFRASEGAPFREAMNQEMASTIFYGNVGTAPEEFTGLSIRYSSLSAANAQNIVNGGGSGSDNTSIWLVLWGPNTVFGIYPRGSMSGLQHWDYGEVTVETTAGIAGNRMRAYQERWQWKAGLAVADWRAVVRIANIDVSNLVGESSAADLIKLMKKATYRVPTDLVAGGRGVFYMNRTVAQMLDIQEQAAVSTGGGIRFENVQGRRVGDFRGYRVQVTDALLETEAAVT